VDVLDVNDPSCDWVIDIFLFVDGSIAVDVLSAVLDVTEDFVAKDDGEDAELSGNDTIVEVPALVLG